MGCKIDVSATYRSESAFEFRNNLLDHRSQCAAWVYLHFHSNVATQRVPFKSYLLPRVCARHIRCELLLYLRLCLWAAP